MRDNPNCLEILFNADMHVRAGADRSFYGDNPRIRLHYDAEQLNRFVDSDREYWLRDLNLIEKTVRYPDACRMERASCVFDEANYDICVKLRRSFGNLRCECTLINIDGCLCVPLVGRYAPNIKEV